MKKAYTIFLIMASCGAFYVFGFWHGMVEAEREEPPKIVEKKIPVEKAVISKTEVKKPVDEKPKEFKIVITKSLVSRNEAYGIVGPGSHFFDYRNTVNGYLLQLKKGEEIVRSCYCLPNEVDLFVKKMRFEANSKDSIITFSKTVKVR